MYIIIIQARMGSLRFPGKILNKLLGKEIILWTYDRCKKSIADEVMISTTIELKDDILEKIFNEYKIKYFRGSEFDVLDRYFQTCENLIKDKNNLKIIRVTSDCPFVDTNIINRMISFFESNDYDYLTNHSPNAIIPEGSGIEIFKYSVLKFLWENEKDINFREHVTGLLKTNNKFNINLGYYDYKILNYNDDIEKIKFIKLSIDTKHEYENSKEICEYFNRNDFTYDDILQNYFLIFK